jgi:O-acetyl-ADP-ribose deacetylase (regulator of RNase III)
LYNLKSIAFCCISTGVFNFPQDLAAEIAVETVKSVDTDLDYIIFDVFTDRDYLIYKDLLEGEL